MIDYKINVEAVLLISLEKENTRKLEVVVWLPLTFLTWQTPSDVLMKMLQWKAKGSFSMKHKGVNSLWINAGLSLKRNLPESLALLPRTPRVEAEAPGVNKPWQQPLLQVLRKKEKISLLQPVKEVLTSEVRGPEFPQTASQLLRSLSSPKYWDNNKICSLSACPWTQMRTGKSEKVRDTVLRFLQTQGPLDR